MPTYPRMVGLGPNRLLARLATKRAKPDGLHAIHSVPDGAALIASEPVTALPGIGRAISAKLQAIGVGTRTPNICRFLPMSRV